MDYLIYLTDVAADIVSNDAEMLKEHIINPNPGKPVRPEEPVEIDYEYTADDVKRVLSENEINRINTELGQIAGKPVDILTEPTFTDLYNCLQGSIYDFAHGDLFIANIIDKD